MASKDIKQKYTFLQKMDTSPILGGKFNFNLPLFITDLKKKPEKEKKKNC